MSRITQISSRRSKHHAVLIGDAGVGKTAIVEGFAQLLSGGTLPMDFRVLSAEVTTLFPARPNPQHQRRIDDLIRTLAMEANVVLCIEGLFDLATDMPGWGAVEALNSLEPHLSNGSIRCIATGTPAGLRKTAENAPLLARHFEVVSVEAPNPSEAVNILNGLKTRYEQFHGVVFGDGTIEAAVYSSGRFLAHRSLPDRAIDLLDESVARVRLRRETGVPEVAETRKRIRQHAREVELAVLTHDFASAREHESAERAERAKLRELLEQGGAIANIVTPDDVEQVLADRAGVSVEAVRKLLSQKGRGDLEHVMKELAARISIDANEWVALLAAYLARSSDAEVDALVAAIQAARTTPS